MAKHSIRMLSVAVLLALSSCSSNSDKGSAPPGRCADVSVALAEKIMQQHAIASLPDEARAELAASLEAGGRVCLGAPTETIACNSGGARAPEMRTCCRFTRPPEGTLSGLPQRMRIRRDPSPETPPAVDLELRGVVTDLSLDQRCNVPTCAADRATARPQIAVTGRVNSPTGSTEFEVNVDLDVLVDLTCDSIQSELSRDPSNDRAAE